MSKLSLLVLSLVLFLSPQFVLAVAITFDNGGANQIWSNSANFGGTAASGNDVTFNNTAGSGTAGTTTNIVDSSVSINSLTYISTNGTGTTTVPPTITAPSTFFHTTQINSTNVLTVNGPLYIGKPTSDPAYDLVGTTVTFKGDSPGNGTLTVNNTGSNILINPIGGLYYPAHTVLLDMSSLGTFNANVNVFRVGTSDGGNTSLYLAQTNVITANEFSAGLNPWNATDFVRLGQTNTINTDLLRVSGPSPQNNAATLNFNTGLTNPTVQFRAKNGTSRIGTVAIGYVSNTSGDTQGLMDLNGGTVDALFGNVIIGVADASALGQQRSGTGILQFNAGTIDATTVTLSNAGPWNGLTAGPQQNSGTLTISGTGTFIADTINLTDRASGTASNTSAVLNLSGGTLRATTIQKGAVLGTGTATLSFNFNSGTLGNKLGANSTVDASTPISILTSGTHNFNAEAGRTVTINSVVGGAGTGAVVMNGLGTVKMLNTNTYVAPTLVNSGTLGGKGSATSNFTVASGATLSPGASAGALLTNTLTLQAGSNLAIELGGTTAGTTYDQVISSGAVSVSGNLIVSFINGFSPSNLDVFTIVTGPSITGTFSTVTILGTYGSFDILYNANSIQLTNFSVPEPSSLSLLGSLTLVGMLRRRRRAAV